MQSFFEWWSSWFYPLDAKDYNTKITQTAETKPQPVEKVTDSKSQPTEKSKSVKSDTLFIGTKQDALYHLGNVIGQIQSSTEYLSNNKTEKAIMLKKDVLLKYLLALANFIRDEVHDTDESNESNSVTKTPKRKKKKQTK